MSHYLRWQRALPAIARRLDSEVDFDLVHHATYATFYTPAGVEAVDKPMVWGPVGGADRVPVRLWRALGVKGILGEVSRFVAQTLLWAMSGSPHNASRRLVVLAQNRATANALNLAGVRIVPNATSVTVEAGFETTPGPRNRDVVMVARLIGWKGGWLAINAMRYVKLATRLRILGDGPDRRRLEKLVRRLRLGDRVEFTDRVPRDLVLKIVRHAGVILHPALRDEASLAVGEAMSLGTPVVLLDGTGAHGVAATWRDGFCAVKPKSARVTARALAAAIDASLDDPPPVLTSAHPSNLDFSKEILWAYQSAADHS